MNAPMTLGTLLGPDCPAEHAGLLIAGLAMDSRELRAGEVFVALAGRHSHGIAHAGAAVARGAVAIIAEAPLPDGITVATAVPVLAFHALRARLGAWADRVHAAPSAALDVVGVTGTNGKTSTVQFIAQAAATLGRRPATQGTLGSGPVGALAAGERTTPDVCVTHRFLRAMREAGCDLVAMEVSSHALDQGRVDGVRFRVAAYTHLTRDHLDYHGTMEAYFQAKARLFAWPGLRAAVIHLDCPYGERLRSLPGTAVELWGTSAKAHPEARLSAEDIGLDHRGLRFALVEGAERHVLATALYGRFNVDNLLTAAGVLRALGHPLREVAAALQAMAPVPGRMNRLGGDPDPVIVVDYAHTPDAIAKALAALREHGPRRLAIVFGCGGERDRGKRPLMAAAAEAGADTVYLTDDNPRGEDGDAIVADTLAGFTAPGRVVVERDRRRAIARAIAAATTGDIVLIAGKGHEPYQEIAGRKLPFDDRQVAAECLARRAA
jgi:UDP-N-acetylmuramoyl-L-alanyl-D-glutamate--2,6-diaminopimelate ligase